MSTTAQRVIVVATDYAGLRIAACELLTEWFEHDSDESTREMAKGAANEDAIVASFNRRTLSPGYYDRAAYLFELEGLITSGVTLTADNVEPSEWRGLNAIKQARADFEREHPPCPHCYTRNRQFDVVCRACHQPLKRRGE